MIKKTVFVCLAAALFLIPPASGIAQEPLKIGILPIVEALPFILMEKEGKPENLEIIVFIENDREAARELALKMKKMISALINADVKKRLRLSWFDIPETIQTVDADQSVLLSQGLLLFTHTTTETEKEASI